MDQLPPEIIELILSASCLRVEDIVSCSKICSRFRRIIFSSSYIWKCKFRDKWPQFMDWFDKDFTQWFEETRYIYELSHRTLTILSTMSSRFYKKSELSDCDLEEWKKIVEETPRSYEYVVQDLMANLCFCDDINTFQVIPPDTPGNLTLRYYAAKVLRYIRHHHLSKLLLDYLNLPAEDQILEKGATFVAQWCQPTLNINWILIASQLDHIANQVRYSVRTRYPNHELLKVSTKKFEKWKHKNIEDNQWNTDECRQLMLCLRDVLYNQYKFKGNNSAFYMPENSYIHEVLLKKQGLPIMLAIIYEGVARRVGLKCVPINYPGHFLLRFTEGKREKPGISYYINVFNCGDTMLTVPSEQSAVCPTAKEVVERMANNLELSCRQHITNAHGNVTHLRTVMELCYLINPHDISLIVGLSRIYMWNNIDTRRLENYLLERGSLSQQEQHIIDMLRNYNVHLIHNFIELMQIQPKTRPTNLLYAVGMVMRHLVFNYICVIYDWDPVCSASMQWQQQMGVHKLRFKDQQPFYNVLVEDSSHRYVAQENLITTNEAGFLSLHDDLGRYFSHYFETHYVPNAEKEKEFPDDKDIRYAFHKKMVGLID
ncbi:hypothetical protein FQA39_LY01198 [Lamprigera yunnana]|nr:hypothetical protein FQA39_LY01198 [Lamprigera yunnana]